MHGFFTRNNKAFFTCIPTSTGSKIDHYRVRYTDDNKLTVDDETFFENLTKLVQVGDMLKYNIPELPVVLRVLYSFIFTITINAAANKCVHHIKA